MAEHFASPLFDVAPLHVGDVMLGLGDSIAAGIGAGHVTEGCMRLLAGRLRRLNPSLELAHLAIPSESPNSPNCCNEVTRHPWPLRYNRHSPQFQEA